MARPMRRSPRSMPRERRGVPLKNESPQRQVPSQVRWPPDPRCCRQRRDPAPSLLVRLRDRRVLSLLRRRVHQRRARHSLDRDEDLRTFRGAHECKDTSTHLLAELLGGLFQGLVVFNIKHRNED